MLGSPPELGDLGAIKIVVIVIHILIKQRHLINQRLNPLTYTSCDCTGYITQSLSS